MKKLIGAFFVLLSTMAFSQSSHFGLNMGPSFSLNNYSSYSDYLNSGYAQPGFTLSFDGNYIPTWYFGIGGALVFTTNYVNRDTMYVGLTDVLIGMDAIPGIPDPDKVDYSVGQWSYVNFVVGPTFAYPAGRFQFNLKALVGLSIILPPNETIILNYEDGSQISGYSESQDVKFCYSAGTDIIFSVTDTFSLKVGAEYFHTRTDYTVQIGIEDKQLPAIDRDIDIQSIHTTIGFAYLF